MTMRFVTSSFCHAGGCVGISAAYDMATSSFCQKGECVGITVVKTATSSFCAKGECVDVYADGAGFMAIGDTKLEDPQASALVLDTASYELFRQAIMAGWFDYSRLNGQPMVSDARATTLVFVQLEPERGRYQIGLGIHCGCPDNTEAKLFFDRDEWDAFVNGIKNGEMTPELLRSTDAKV